MKRIALFTVLVSLSSCSSEPKSEEPARNPVEERVVPMRTMIDEADSLVQASPQRLEEAANEAR